jgi:hypothetical protein
VASLDSTHPHLPYPKDRLINDPTFTPASPEYQKVDGKLNLKSPALLEGKYDRYDTGRDEGYTHDEDYQFGQFEIENIPAEG